MYKKILAGSMTSAMLLLSATPVGFAETQSHTDVDMQEKVDQPEIDESKDKLKDTIYVEGADLTEDQKERTRDLLDVKNGTKTYDINVKDVSDYTGTQYDNIKSSAIIKPKKFYKHGVDVDIVTPDNITQVSKESYINASITSGIKDVDIKIASVEPVTGDGALTGIYEALEQQGFEVNEDDAKNATEEINDLSQIDQNHRDDEDYSDEKMNNAVADMKGQVADKKHGNEKVDEQAVRDIVDETLKEKGLDDVLNDNEKIKVENIVINASNSKVMKEDPKSVSDQTSQLKNKLSKSIDDAKEKANYNKGFFSKLIDKIKGWF